MTPVLQGYLFAVLYVAAAIAAALVLYKLGLSKKYTRKLVHILVGFEWVILYHFMGHSIHFMIVCLVFTAGLAASYFLKLLPAMSSDGENDPGTVYYGVAMCIMILYTLFVDGNMMIPFGIGVFCTSLGDGLAGLVGQLVTKHNPKIFRGKSLFGTLVNLVASSAVTYVFSLVFDLPLTVFECVLVGVFSAGIELIGAFGLDNILITLGTAFLTYGLILTDVIDSFLVPILVTPFLIAAVIEKRALTTAGLVGALVMDAVVSLVFMNFGFTVLISFFVLSLVVDKIKGAKKKVDTVESRSDSTRDLIQVTANGLVPTLAAIMFALTLNGAFLLAYVASLAEAFGDTAASGLGVFSKNTFDLFKLRKCECGISGGMSWIGTFSSLVGAVLLSFIPYFFGVYGASLLPVLITSAAAFLGVVFDSLLGSLLQVKYKCTVCGKINEREEHCGKPTEQIGGFRFFDNDVVNLLSGVFAATLAALGSALL